MKVRFASILVIGVMALSATALAQSPCDDLSRYPVRFAILGDRTGEHQEGVFGECVAEVARIRPDFVMTVGDMIEGYTSDTLQMHEEWDEYLALKAPLTMPVYHTPGNHDITSDVMEPVFRSRIGEPYYSFDQRGIHFVVLDDSRIESWDEFADTQREWLIRDLADHADACYTIVFFHKPLWYRTLGDGQPDALHEIFVANGVDAVFSGHFHKYFAANYDGIIYTAIGSSGAATEESPTGLLYQFGWVTVDGQGIHPVPIAKGAVLPWDVQTTGEMRVSETVLNSGLRFAQPVLIAKDLTAISNSVAVTVKGQLPGVVYTDTLRWNVPSGWSVEPESYVFELSGDTTLNVPFALTVPKKLYPLPTLSTDLPYAADRTVSVSHELEIARAVTCVPAKGTVVIDGRLDESCWQTPTTLLFDTDGKSGGQDSVAVFFAYTDSDLYMGVYCHESKIDSLFAEMTERDAAVYTEDAFGFLFQPTSDGNAYQFYVNPLGTVYDQHIVRNSDGHWVADPTWNGNYDVSAVIGDDGYRLEVRFPLDQFGATLRSGDQWRINFRRKQRHLNAAYALQIPWAYDPSSFGLLSFK